MSKKYAIGVDLGGTHIGAAMVDCDGNTGEIKECKLAPEERGVENILNKMVLLIERVISEENIPGEDILGAGIDVPGYIDTLNGICHFSPNFPEWTEVKVGPVLEEKLNMPVMILNDVNAAALGEKFFGAGKYVNNMICLTLGTGIGGGVIIENKLCLGASQGAGEIGHITIEPAGYICGCGNQGCFEAMTARSSIIKRATDKVVKGEKTLLSEFDEISPLAVFEAAEKGDKAAIEVFRETGKYLGIGLANLILILNPERIVIGGRIANAKKYLFPPAIEEIKKRVKMFPPETTEIVQAELGEKAGLVGAAVYVFQQKYKEFGK